MAKKTKLSQFSDQASFVKRIVLFSIVIITCLLSLAPFVSGPHQKVAYMGASFCGSCHVEEFKKWSLSPHKEAFAHLSKDKQKNTFCLSCHATDIYEAGQEFFKGVQCESCHGPGKYYASLHIKKDPHLNKLLFMQKPNEDTCLRCHNKDANSWSVQESMKKIDHWTIKNKIFSGKESIQAF